VVDHLNCPDLSFIFLKDLKMSQLEMVPPVHTVGKSLMAKDSFLS